MSLTYTNSAFINKKNSLSVLLGQEIQKTVNTGATQDIRYFPVGISADKAFNNLQLASASTTAYSATPCQLEPGAHFAGLFLSTIDWNYDQRFYAKFT